MIALRIRHRTTYDYRHPVALVPHRLMLRPRESRDLRLISSNLSISPQARVTWAQDVFGNAVATAAFQGSTQKLVIESNAEIQLDAAEWPVFEIAASAIFYPFEYSPDEILDLARWRWSNPQIRKSGCGAGRALLSSASRPIRSRY